MGSLQEWKRLLRLPKDRCKKNRIATCIGLMNEAKIFAKILKAKGLESYSVICKVGQ